MGAALLPDLPLRDKVIPLRSSPAGSRWIEPHDPVVVLGNRPERLCDLILACIVRNADHIARLQTCLRFPPSADGQGHSPSLLVDDALDLARRHFHLGALDPHVRGAALQLVMESGPQHADRDLLVTSLPNSRANVIVCENRSPCGPSPFHRRGRVTRYLGAHPRRNSFSMCSCSVRPGR